MKIKHKSFRKILSIGLCMIMTLSSLSGAYAATNPANSQGDVSMRTMKDWISKGYVTKYEKGEFKADASVARAELAGVVNRVFQLKELDKQNFKDVKKKDPCFKDMAIAKKAGYFIAGKNGDIKPAGTVSRQELSFIIMKVMKLEKPKSLICLKALKDRSQIDNSFKNSVEVVLEKGYLMAKEDGSFHPELPVTKAEALAILDKCMETVKVTYDKAGTFSPGKVIGSVVVNAPEVQLENAVVLGDLIIEKGVGEGNVTLLNVVVKGNTIVKGGGMNSIVVQDSTFNHLIVMKVGGKVRVLAKGNTAVNDVEMRSGGKLEEAGLTGAGFGYVLLAEELDSGTPINLIGNYENVEILGDQIIVDLSGGKIGNLTVAESGENTKIQLGKDAVVEQLTLSAAAIVEGAGIVQNASINKNGAILAVTTLKVTTAPGVTANITNTASTPAGSGSTTGGTGSVGGSGGGSGGNGGGGGGATNKPTVVPTIVPTIIPLSISAPSLTLSKNYDGNTSAAVTIGTLIGIQGTDKVTVSGVANYDSGSVGTGKTITVVYTLGGLDSYKYKKPSDYKVVNGEIKGIAPGALTVPEAVPGITQHTTVLTLKDTASSENRLVYKVGDTEVTGLNTTSAVTDWKSFASDYTEISVVKDQYVTIYELNSGGQVVRYVSRKIVQEEIQYLVLKDDGHEGLMITGYDKAGGTNLTLPEKVRGKQITEIGEFAFLNKELTSVVISDSVKIVGGASFCKNKLTKVALGKGVTDIYDAAFQSNLLTEITISTNVMDIGNGVFYLNPLKYVTAQGPGCTVNPRAFGSTTFTTAYVAGGAGTYKHVSDSTFEKVEATVGSVTVTGAPESPLTDTELTITLNNDTLKSAIDKGANLKEWFTNLPTGLTVKAKSAVLAGGASVIGVISGTPTLASSEVISVIVPAEALECGQSITANVNSSAKYGITAAVQAGALSVSAATPGLTQHTTVLTIGEKAGAGNRLVYKVGGTKVTGLTSAATVTDGTDFTSNSTEILVEKEQYVTIYELNDKTQVVRYVSRKIVKEEIQYLVLVDDGAGGLKITDYDATGGTDLTLPEKIMGKTVTEIGMDAFENKGLTSAVISNSVQTIEILAFCNNHLTKVTLGTGLKRIAAQAFFINSLEEITIPENVSSIERHVFDANPLVCVMIKPSACSMQSQAFGIYDNLTTIYTTGGAGTYKCVSENTFGKVQATVGAVTVAGAPGTTIADTEVTITLNNDTFKSAIEQGANLSTWFTNLPTGLTVKAKEAVSAGGNSVIGVVSGTPTLASSEAIGVTIPAGVLDCGQNITANVNSSAKYEIAAVLPAGALTVTAATPGITQHTTVLTIGETAGTGNRLVYKVGDTEVTGLTSASIVADGTDFTSNSTEILVEKEQYVTIYELNDKTQVVRYVSRKIVKGEIQYLVLVDDGVGGLKITGYDKSGGLELILPEQVMGKTVTEIGMNAFENKGLASVAISNSIEFIGSNAFDYNHLTKVTFGTELSTIGPVAFRNNFLTEITIPANVSYIGISAFAENPMIYVTIQPSTCYIEDNAFSPMDNDFRIAYEAGGAGTYHCVSGTWSKVQATVGSVTVAGAPGSAIEDSEVTIALNDTFKADIGKDADLSAWFTNLPTGLTVKAKSAVSAGGTSVIGVISGTPTVASSEVISVTIPAEVLDCGQNITVTGNLDAKYRIVE